MPGKMIINARMVAQAIEDFADSMEDIGFDAVKTDLNGEGDDPRSPHLVGCWRNCTSKDALDEISAYMNRLHKEILGIDPRDPDRARAMKYWKRTVDNLERCVKRSP